MDTNVRKRYELATLVRQRAWSTCFCMKNDKGRSLTKLLVKYIGYLTYNE